MADLKNFYMYTANMPPMQRGKVEKTLGKLIRYEGVIMNFAEFVAKSLCEGYTPEVCEEMTAGGRNATKYRLSDKTTIRGPFNKTMYDFAVYLQACGAVTEDAQNALRTQENEHIEALQQEKTAEQEREQADRRRKRDEYAAFKAWLREKAMDYFFDPRLTIVTDVMTKMYGDYPFERCAELLVKIDNLQDKRVCASLRETLHPMNKGSRKAFTAITGIRLPAGVRATEKLILSLDDEKGAQAHDRSEAAAG